MPKRGLQASSRQRAKRFTPVDSFKHHTGDSMIWLGSTPILKEKTLGMVRGTHFSSPNLTTGLWLVGLVTPCHRGTIHLQASTLLRDSNSVPTAHQSASH
ncbi:hypothetical protein TNCV_1834601 [Trichonephila clavipes]|nr:hypothetical protein TNCV_1834601 [Trichonephila clavipes]